MMGMIQLDPEEMIEIKHSPTSPLEVGLQGLPRLLNRYLFLYGKKSLLHFDACFFLMLKRQSSIKGQLLLLSIR